MRERLNILIQLSMLMQWYETITERIYHYPNFPALGEITVAGSWTGSPTWNKKLSESDSYS